MQKDDLAESMLKEFGPLMGGEELRRALGFRTWAAFARSVRNGTLGLPVFEIPNRRGRFALTVDVAKWLGALKVSHEKPSSEKVEASKHEEDKT